MKRTAVLMTLSALLIFPEEGWASWKNLLADDFSNLPTNWTYTGVLNATNAPLFRYDALGEQIAAEWNQLNYFSDLSDPYIISNSFYSRALPQPLTDRHSFRLRATLRIDAGSIPDTTEFYQIANIGLYGLTNMGPDRTLADDWSMNSVKLKNASDLVEFNYFINNNSFGFNPNTAALIAGRVTNNTDFVYITGSSADSPWFNNTDMGAGNYLPANTNLYLELSYFGGGTHARRRLHVAIYTDPLHTQVLSVNGVPQYYWTQPLPRTESFELTHVAMVNYAAQNWFGPVGVGTGAWDDVSVDLFDGQVVTEPLENGAVVVTWTSRVGDHYAVVATPHLIQGPFVTQTIVTATAGFTSWTSAPSGSIQFFFVNPVP